MTVETFARHTSLTGISKHPVFKARERDKSKETKKKKLFLFGYFFYIQHLFRMKRHKTMNFSTPFMERAARSSKFYAQINLLIDWTKIEILINRYYTKGNTLKGEKPYGGLMLFKMLLIEIWNGLSDVQTEDLLNDSISAMRFCKKSVSADKGYKAPRNDQLLKERKIKNRIQHKTHRNRPLTHWQKTFNKLVSKTCYVAERTFGAMKRLVRCGSSTIQKY